MTDNNRIFLVDSNILIYAYSEKNGAKKQIALGLLRKCWNKEVNYAVSSQNLAEFFQVSYTNYKVDIELIKEVVSDIIEFVNFIKISYDEKTIIDSIDLVEKFGIQFWDALLIATMKERSISNIYTENIKDFQIPGVNAINPFKTGQVI